jgi:DNA-binding NarL/FixJ family response regulator
MTQRHTVVLAGAPRLFQEALARALDDDGDFDVLEVLDEAAAAETTCLRLRPAVVVIDSAGGGRAAVGACGAIKARDPRTRVLLTSEAEDPDLLVTGVQVGIDGFATREDTFADLVAAIRTVARGEARIPPRMLGVLLRSLIERRREEEETMERLALLTDREREVASLLVAGLNRDAIARELVISPETARTHVQRVLSKLGVHSQLEAAAMLADHFAGARYSQGLSA